MCVCILVLITWQVKHMYYIILLDVACLVLPHFSTLPHNQQFWGKNLLHIKCVLIFS